MPPDAEELISIAGLSSGDIQEIDSALVINAAAHWQKVAFVVSGAMLAFSDRFLDIPDVFFAERIKVMVSQGILESQGNLSRMRFSEIRLSAAKAS